jgi:hypothetical protein
LANPQATGACHGIGGGNARGLARGKVVARVAPGDHRPGPRVTIIESIAAGTPWVYRTWPAKAVVGTTSTWYRNNLSQKPGPWRSPRVAVNDTFDWPMAWDPALLRKFICNRPFSAPEPGAQRIEGQSDQAGRPNPCRPGQQPRPSHRQTPRPALPGLQQAALLRIGQRFGLPHRPPDGASSSPAPAAGPLPVAPLAESFAAPASSPSPWGRSASASVATQAMLPIQKRPLPRTATPRRRQAPLQMRAPKASGTGSMPSKCARESLVNPGLSLWDAPRSLMAPSGVAVVGGLEELPSAGPSWRGLGGLAINNTGTTTNQTS